MLILALFLSQWMLAIFVQSSFHHRYASHRMFSMSPVMERVFHVLAFVAQGSSYLSARAYAILHREHHAFSDTARDPHSPGHTGTVVRMMWETAKRYSAHFEGRSKPEPRFLERQIRCVDGALQHGRIHTIDPPSAQLGPGSARLGDAALRQRYVHPAGEAILEIPLGLPVTQQDQVRHGARSIARFGAARKSTQ